jgi:Raf kinase inhibitor-like YbhB/YbcL family protein
VQFVHWIIANVPPTLDGLPEGVPTEERALGGAAIQGSNSKSKTGYFGPRPPAGEPPHPYHFQIFALDTELSLPSGYNRQTLLKAMRDHVLAKGELIANYGKTK